MTRKGFRENEILSRINNHLQRWHSHNNKKNHNKTQWCVFVIAIATFEKRWNISHSQIWIHVWKTRTNKTKECLLRSAIRKRIWRESVNKSQDFKTIVKISRSFGFVEPRLEYRLNVLFCRCCVSGWINARIEKCTKREWNDERFSYFLSLSLPLDLMQHFLLVPISYGVIECVNSTSILMFPMLYLHHMLTSTSFDLPTSYWQLILQAEQHAIYRVHKFKPNYLTFRLVRSILFAYQIHFHLENHRLFLTWKFDTLSTITQLLCVDLWAKVCDRTTFSHGNLHNNRKCRNHCYSLRFVLVKKNCWSMSFCHPSKTLSACCIACILSVSLKVFVSTAGAIAAMCIFVENPFEFQKKMFLFFFLGISYDVIIYVPPSHHFGGFIFCLFIYSCWRCKHTHHTLSLSPFFFLSRPNHLNLILPCL